MCHACLEACPQGVKVSEILILLRNLATEMGAFPEHLKAEVASLLENGLINAGGAAITRRRQQLGLPDVPKPNIANYKKVADLTGFTKLIGYQPKQAGKGE